MKNLLSMIVTALGCVTRSGRRRAVRRILDRAVSAETVSSVFASLVTRVLDGRDDTPGFRTAFGKLSVVHMVVGRVLAAADPDGDSGTSVSDAERKAIGDSVSSAFSELVDASFVRSACEALASSVP